MAAVSSENVYDCIMHDSLYLYIKHQESTGHTTYLGKGQDNSGKGREDETSAGAEAVANRKFERLIFIILEHGILLVNPELFLFVNFVTKR